MVEFQVGTKEESVEDILKEAKAPVQIKIDMTSLEAMFKKADVSIAGMLATANVTEVTDIESREKAIEMATQARALSNLIEKKKKDKAALSRIWSDPGRHGKATQKPVIANREHTRTKNKGPYG